MAALSLGPFTNMKSKLHLGSRDSEDELLVRIKLILQNRFVGSARPRKFESHPSAKVPFSGVDGLFTELQYAIRNNRIDTPYGHLPESRSREVRKVSPPEKLHLIRFPQGNP